MEDRPAAELPIIAKRRRPVRAALLHAGRLLLFAALIWLIRQQHIEFAAAQRLARAGRVTLSDARQLFPAAASIADAATANGRWLVYDAHNATLGYVLQTSPESDSIVGYAGPTNTLLGFSPDDQIVAMAIAHSADTADHVKSVRESERFLHSLDGLTAEQAAEADVEAVSGATLTSLAITEGLRMRLGGHRPSPRFPNELTLEELQRFFPDAARLATQPGRSPETVDVLGEDGERLGTALRTSPATDDVMGYQGPTDSLIALGADGRVIGVRVRASFDNEPYVGYVRDDYYFRDLFSGLTLEELAKFDPAAAEVEGVSGATMTSLAVARGLPEAAAAALQPPPEPPVRRVRFATRDAGTILILLGALAMTFTRLRGRRWARIGFQIALIGYFGFLNGDLLSQALLVGWSQSGVPWRFAPGLTLLTAAALVIPVVSKRQIYCHHVCPFGAAQQLTRGRLPWRVSLPGKLTKALEAIPAVLLVVVVSTAMLHWPLNLAGIEPFDAFVFWVAGASTLAIAGVGLIASMFVPMAYCRFGCPTGAMLGFLRFHADADRFTRRDAFAIALLLAAVALRLAG
ncbi:MAG: FMN-binding protein [Planctomycetales bacterium]|nr:FMN-binding protein [Planctomycetales bacterium]